MAHVCIVDSPSWVLFNPRQFLHLGCGYLAGSLRAAGHEVEWLDCHELTSWEDNRLIIHEDRLPECDVLGVSGTTANVHWGSEMARVWPAKFKVLGGSHATSVLRGPHQRFKVRKNFESFDYIITGEAEETFVGFCDSPGNKSLPGLAWFEGDKLRMNEEARLPDVTKLPGPAFDLWSGHFYGGGLSANGYDRKLDLNEAMTASLFTARGCPYACTFCADARTKLREETPEQVEKQISQLADLGVTCIRIQDDVLTIRKDRCRLLADMLHDYRMRWRGNTRVNLIDLDLFSYMASKGCVELGFGVEHGSAKMLNLMRKGTTPERNTESIKMCQSIGMVAKAFLMVGFPGETNETIEEMKQWILATRPSAVTWSLFQPYPGSDVWNRPETYGVRLPENAFERFWCYGALSGTEEELVLDLPTISKKDLQKARLEIGELIDNEIGHRDRRRMDGMYHASTSAAIL